MTTYRELVFMVLDKFKISNDDSYFDIPHIVFLINKYKALLLYKYYLSKHKEIPEYLLKTVCLDLETTDDCIKGTTVKSVYKIPKMISYSKVYNLKVYPLNDAFNSKEWTYINYDRFAYSGNNKWLKNIIYFTVFNEYLYVKSFNSGYEYLKRVMIKGLFETPGNLYDTNENNEYLYQCDDIASNNECTDPLDLDIGIDDFMIAPLLDSVFRDLTPNVYRPEDVVNNASDNLSGLQGANPDRAYNTQSPNVSNNLNTQRGEEYYD